MNQQRPYPSVTVTAKAAAAIRRGMIRQRAQAFVLAHCTIAGPDGQPVTEA